MPTNIYKTCFPSTFFVSPFNKCNTDSHGTQKRQWVFPPEYGSHICRKLAGFVKWLHTHFDSHWTRTRGLSSRDVPFQDPPPGQQGQVSQMWYPFPTCPVRTTGFVPTVFISRHSLTHAGAHTPSRLGQLWLSASLDTRVSSLPWPITGFLFSQTAPLSWLITPRLTSFTCLLSCPLRWPVSGPPSTEMTESGSHSPASFICQALYCSSSLNTDL